MKKFRFDCQKWNLRLQKKFLGEKHISFEKKFSRKRHWALSKNYAQSRQSFIEKLAKAAIHLPGEPMQLKVVIEGKTKPFSI